MIGHARDAGTHGTPRGLQFILGSPSNPELVDTITMANLGYLQLKANPGVWQFQIRSGRSADLYDIQSFSYSKKKSSYSSPINQNGALIIINTFDGVTIYPVVVKKRGKEQVTLLQSDEDLKIIPSMWDSIKKGYMGQLSRY